jgi:hypothetical protein
MMENFPTGFYPLISMCHPEAAVKVRMTPEVIELRCALCEQPTTRLDISTGAYESLLQADGHSLEKFKDGLVVVVDTFASLDSNDCLFIECACCKNELFILPLVPGTAEKITGRA